jgi:hypothetical protein
LAALPPRKEPRHPLTRRVGGPQSRAGHFGQEKWHVALPGFEPQSYKLPVAQTSNRIHSVDDFKKTITRKEAIKESLLVIQNWAQNIIRDSVKSSEFIFINFVSFEGFLTFWDRSFTFKF